MRYPGLIIAFWAIAGACLADQEAIKDYEQARHLFWSVLYAGGGSTLYCGEPFGQTSAERRGVNIEHVYPMSWVTRALHCGRRSECRNISARFNHIEADLHNLYPAKHAINDARGSYRFGIVAGEPREFGSCDFEVDERARATEPRPASRGEIARAMFYMQNEYGLEIFRRQAELLRRWHWEDPVNDVERRRNDVIEQLQGTRNPFVDDPNLVDKSRF